MGKDEGKFSDTESPPDREPADYETNALIGNGERSDPLDAMANQKKDSPINAGIQALKGLNAPILLAIASYAVCSSCMLVVNKVRFFAKI